MKSFKKGYRSLAAALAITGGVIAGCASSASAQELTRVRVSVVPIMSIAPFYAAIQLGYFKEEGLDVTTETNHQGGAVGIPGMVAGAYEVVYTNTPSALLAMQQGINLSIIAGSSKNPQQPPDQVALIGRAEDKITTGKQLEGKSIAINARNGVQWLFARAWVKATGGDPEKVTYREVAFPQMVDAVKNKQVDAALAIDPFLTFSRRDPSLAIVGWAFNVVAPAIQGAIYVTLGETAQKRPELAQKFVRAHDKGGQWVNKNFGSDEYMKLVSGYTKMDPALISAMPKIASDTDIDIESLKRMEALMIEHGLLTKGVDSPAKVFKAK
jgi:NitT/TauT family transport system substrate-binding protein